MSEDNPANVVALATVRADRAFKAVVDADPATILRIPLGQLRELLSLLVRCREALALDGATTEELLSTIDAAFDEWTEREAYYLAHPDWEFV